MHSVEDPKRKANVDNRGPHCVPIEVQLPVIVKLRTGAKGRDDPELSGKETFIRDNFWYSPELRDKETFILNTSYCMIQN